MSWQGYVSHETCDACGKKLFSARELEIHTKRHGHKPKELDHETLTRSSDPFVSSCERLIAKSKDVIPMTARNTWKAFERQIAKDLQGRRIPVTGIDRSDRDIESTLFWAQAKLRKSLPAWLFDWLGGICGVCPEGKVGILILRTPRMRNADALVVMRYSDFIELHGAPGDLKQNEKLQ